jgi:polar amino acid transport system permease protein
VVGLLYYLMAKLIARACGVLEHRLRAHSTWKGMA